MSSLRWAFCWLVAGMFTVAPSVQAAEEVGKAVLIKTAVTGQNGPLAEQAPVHRDERIKTSQSGLGQFVFRDGTKLAVGWGSSVVIDKYVFNDDASVKQLSIKAVKGTFRWISGKSKSSAYSIVTPAGTIGVRGTVFDFYVNRDGTTAMVLLEGKASFCGSNGCKQLTKKCDCVIGTPRKGVTDPTRVSRATLAALGTNKALPFLSGTQELTSSFGRGPSCGMRTASIQQNEGSPRQPSRNTSAPANRAAPAPSASPRAADPAPSAPAPEARPTGFGTGSDPLTIRAHATGGGAASLATGVRRPHPRLRTRAHRTRPTRRIHPTTITNTTPTTITITIRRMTTTMATTTTGAVIATAAGAAVAAEAGRAVTDRGLATEPTARPIPDLSGQEGGCQSLRWKPWFGS